MTAEVQSFAAGMRRGGSRWRAGRTNLPSEISNFTLLEHRHPDYRTDTDIHITT